MKQKILFLVGMIFLFCNFSVVGQVYPFSENFNSMTSFTNPTGWTCTIPGFQIYSNHGMSGTNGMTKQMTTLGVVADSVISPLIGPLTALSQFSFDYRVMETNLYPSFSHAMAVGESIQFFASNAIASLPLLTIDLTNHVNSTSWAHFDLPIGSLAGNSGKLIIKVVRANSDFFADFNNISFADVSAINKSDVAGSHAVVYPNPIAKGKKLSLSGIEPGKYQTQVLSYDGKIISENAIEISKGINELSNSDLLKKGFYFLQLRGYHQNYLLKFVVQN